MPSFSDIKHWTARIYTHLNFLKTIGQDAKNFETEHLNHQINVYRHLLPLVAKHGAQKVWIPESAMWVFHVHLLHPVQFVRDCRDNFNYLVLHNPFASNNSKEQTAQWFREYHNGLELDTVLADSAATSTAETALKIGQNFSLVEAAQRQQVFTQECQGLWNVNIPLELSNYQKFIGAIKVMLEKSENLAAELVPTREIDLIWHTHMRYPAEYNEYVKRETGYLLNHEDAVPDLKKQFQFTQQVWNDLYKENYEMIQKKATCCCNAVDNEKELVLAVHDEPLPVQLEFSVLNEEIACSA